MGNEQNKQGASTDNESETFNSVEDSKGAGVKIPPPLVLLLFLGLAFSADYLLPLDLPTNVLLTYLGGALVMVSIGALMILGLKFRREKTSIEPWKPTHKILSTGLYAYSRNPIYAGFCLFAVGLGLLVGSIWVLFSFVPIAFTIYKTAIAKEEQYLESKFADEYRQYKSQVRRWI